MLRWHVISSVFARNFKQYFTSVLGYLFTVAFVLVCAILTFSPQFFADNLASLDQLTRFFPWLLLFFVPAVTMGVWADEKKLGTDAILFTLPASDLEILLGKFFSVVAVYSVALLFSITQLIALWQLGNPDMGVLIATYFGYWLAGVALLSIGMFASSLTRSTTVAFVVGAVLCAIPVVIGNMLEGNQFWEGLGVGAQLRDFSLGLISLSGLFYFGSLTVFMLYLNLVVISKRHWSRGQQVTLAGHFVARVVALAVALISVTMLSVNFSSVVKDRIDLTSESLYTLDQTTRDTIANLAEKDRPVTIQAFISDSVPRRYVATKKQLVGLLRQYDRLGGSNIDVRFVSVTPNSDQVQEARSLGMESQPNREEVAGRIIEQDVFMGALITSTLGEVALPFIDSDSSIEYQLTRSLATTTDDARRLKIGVLQTDAHFTNLRFQGREFDFNTVSTLKRLRQQYEITDITEEDLAELVSPATPDKVPGDESDAPSGDTTKPSRPDVMLVADPSSLARPAMDNLVKYIGEGHPTLILADPLPFYNRYAHPYPDELGILNAPRQMRISPQAQWSPMASTMSPKAYGGRAIGLMDALGIQWDFDQIVWHLFWPHAGFKPKLHDILGDRWPDYYGDKENTFVFIRSYGGHKAFNPESPISAGLQELMFVYPGSVEPAKDAKTTFQPLVTLKPDSGGKLRWEEFTEGEIVPGQSFDPTTGQMRENAERMNPVTGQSLRRLTPRPSRRRDKTAHVLAAHIKGTGDDKTNVVFIADLDFVSDFFYEQQEALGEPLDNYAFLANAIETLAGDTSFARLRNRRAMPRTLTRLETTTDEFRRAAAASQEAKEIEIQNQMNEEQAKLDEAVQNIMSDTEMTLFQKAQQSSFQQQTAQKDFELRRQELESELADEIDRIKASEQRNIDFVEGRSRFWSILLAVFPALIIGAIVLVTRYVGEQRHIEPTRRV